MRAKLTLSIEKNVIERAKQHAKRQGRSLSNLVEDLLASVTAPPAKREKDISPSIDALIGILPVQDKNWDYREELTDALEEKYLKP